MIFFQVRQHLVCVICTFMILIRNVFKYFSFDLELFFRFSIDQ